MQGSSSGRRVLESLAGQRAHIGDDDDDDDDGGDDDGAHDDGGAEGGGYVDDNAVGVMLGNVRRGRRGSPAIDRRSFRSQGSMKDRSVRLAEKLGVSPPSTPTAPGRRGESDTDATTRTAATAAAAAAASVQSMDGEAETFVKGNDSCEALRTAVFK